MRGAMLTMIYEGIREMQEGDSYRPCHLQQAFAMYGGRSAGLMDSVTDTLAMASMLPTPQLHDARDNWMATNAGVSASLQLKNKQPGWMSTSDSNG